MSQIKGRGNTPIVAQITGRGYNNTPVVALQVQVPLGVVLLVVDPELLVVHLASIKQYIIRTLCIQSSKKQDTSHQRLVEPRLRLFGVEEHPLVVARAQACRVAPKANVMTLCAGVLGDIGRAIIVVQIS